VVELESSEKFVELTWNDPLRNIFTSLETIIFVLPCHESPIIIGSAVTRWYRHV